MKSAKTKDPNKIIVHASSLPKHQDCPRSWAATPIKEVGERYELAPQGIGSVLGDRAHAGAARMLLAKQLNGTWDYEQALEEQVEELKEILRSAAITWDKTTKEPGVAIEQLASLLFEFHRGVMPTANAALVEMRMKAAWSADLTLTGQMDNIERDGNLFKIFDHKFSSMLSPYHAQLGCYKLLLEAQPWYQAEEGEVQELILNWIQRVSIRAKKGQPQVIQIAYSVDAAESAARKQLEEIERSVKEYRATGDPWAFNARPSSKFCTKKTCRAFGTGFCDQWIDLDPEED